MLHCLGPWLRPWGRAPCSRCCCCPPPPLSFGTWASAYWPRPALHYLKCGNFLATETYFATHIADAPWELPSNQWLKGVDVMNNPGPWAVDPLQQFNLCSSTVVAGLTKLHPPLTGYFLTSLNYFPLLTGSLPSLCFLHLLNKPLALEYLFQLCYWGNPNWLLSPGPGHLTTRWWVFLRLERTWAAKCSNDP